MADDDKTPNPKPKRRKAARAKTPKEEAKVVPLRPRRGAKASANPKPKRRKAARAKTPKEEAKVVPLRPRRGAKASAKPTSARPAPMSAPVGGDALNGRGAGGRFLPGNSIWETRATWSGHPRRFADAKDLWTACLEYFKWVQANPLYENQLVTFQGMATHEPVAKMRPMTIKGLCFFLRISNRTWNEWKQGREDLAPVIVDVEAVIYEQKFSGAAAGLLNANIIARELGLAEKTEVGGVDGAAIKVEDVTPLHPGHDHLADMADRYFRAVQKFAPEAAKQIAAVKQVTNGAGKLPTNGGRPTTRQ